jgi:hypothetical protein
MTKLKSIPGPSVRSCSILEFSRLKAALLCLAVIALCVGCSDGKTSVTGTVTLDSEPVASGVITFIKQDGDLIREGAIIKDGRFEAHAPPGKYRLELSGQKVVGKRKQKGFDGKDEEVEISEELFPPRYNTNSELTEEIKAGHNSLKLDLKSGK